MFFLIPLLLFGIAIGGGYYFHNKKVRFAFTWFFITFFVCSAWLFWAFLTQNQLSSIFFDAWINPYPELANFQIDADKSSWIMGMIVFGWMAAFLFLNVEKMYKQAKARLSVLFPVLTIAIVLYLVLIANSLVSLLMMIAFIDVIEFTTSIKESPSTLTNSKTQLHFLIKILSIFLIILTYLLLQRINEFAFIHNYSILLLYTVVMLRCTILTWIPSTEEVGTVGKNEYRGFIFMAGNFLVAVKLIHMFGHQLDNILIRWAGIGIFAVLSLLSSMYWLGGKEIDSRKRFFIFTLINLMFLLALIGLTNNLWIFALMLFLIIGKPLLASSQQTPLAIKIFYLYIFSGLPFSPFFQFSFQLHSRFENWVSISTIIIVCAILFIGFLPDLFIKRVKYETSDNEEGWFRLLRIIGWTILIATLIIVVIKEINQYLIFTNVSWLFPVIFFIFIVACYYLKKRNGELRKVSPETETNANITGGFNLRKYLTLDRAQNLALIIFQLLRDLSNFMTTLFEGRGGLIWSFVILTILLSIMQIN